MKTKLVFAGMLLSLAALALAGLASASAQRADGPNLLKNPGFEIPYSKQCCQTDLSLFYPNTPIDEVQVPQGWFGWWLQPDLDPAHPGSCLRIADPCVAWHRPEWREANCGPVCADRFRSGNNAQKYFTFWSVHDAGMYQQVSGVAPRARLRFSVYMHAWSTNSAYGPSGGQQSMGMRVGIDPAGGTNPFSPNIVWSSVRDNYDTWGLYTVEVVALSGTVTVYTRSAPVYPLQHNDIYVDDASLVVVGAGAPQPTPTRAAGGSILRPTSAAPSGGNIVTREPLPTPAADGKIYYIVRSGDTLTHIAVRFGTTVARIKLLNGFRGNVIIYTGQRIIIGP